MALNNGSVDPCDFDKQSVRELRVFLRDRGAHVSGNRPELIKRAKGLCKLGTRTLREIQIEDNKQDKLRHEEIFRTPLGEKIPQPKDLKGVWDSDLSRIPFFRTQDLYNYLVLNRSRTFDSENMNAKKQLKAKVFYEDRHVHSVKYHKITQNCSHCYVKAQVIPSLPNETKKKADYEAWACLSKVSGKVHAAGCSCDSGEGESCNHIAALLYALVDITSKHKDGLTAPTSSKCKWNQPRKRKQSPKKSQHLVFKKLKFDDATPSTQKSSIQKPVSVSNVKPLDVKSFGQKLKTCAPHAAFLLSDSDFLSKKLPGTSEKELPTLHNISFMYADTVDLNAQACQKHFSNYFESLKCSQADCLEIEACTKAQSKCDNWKKAREGRLTSSVFGTIFKQREDTKPDSVLKTILGYTSFDTAATRWGRSHEPAARRVYSRTVQTTHPKSKVFSSGLIICEKYPYLGTSPDGLVHCCERCIDKQGLLEIKCPFKFREISPQEACKDKTFCCELIGNVVKLKRKHSYFYQIQGQMGLSGKKWCDFFVWTLKGHSLERIHFDPAVWAEMLSKLISFYKCYVIPELFSERVRRGKALF